MIGIASSIIVSGSGITLDLLAIAFLFSFFIPASLFAVISLTSSFTMIEVGKSSHYSVAILFNSFLGYTVFPMSMFMFCAIKNKIDFITDINLIF